MQELTQRAVWDGRIFVDGEFRTPDGGGTLTVLDKAAQAPIGNAGVASVADVDSAVRAARAAQPDWAAQPYDVRAGVLRAAAAELQSRADEFSELLVRETGCIAGKAAYEIGAAANELFEAAALTSRPIAQIIPSHNPTRVSVAERLPRGVVGCITPWNFPLVLGMRIVAPALALGNAVVLKPSPETPLSGGLVLAELFATAGLPAGLLQVLPGGVDVGQALVAHPDVAMIHFTGSTRTGRQIAEVAGRALKHCSLELGGDNALAVLDDADVDHAAMIGAWSAFHYQGQTCITAGRHIVARELYDRYVEALAARARAITVGDPMDDGVGLGPMVNEAQRDRAHQMLEAAVAAGARIVEGGTYDGLFYRPTVVVDVPLDSELWQAEIFAPIAPVVAVDSDDEALELVNDTRVRAGQRRRHRRPRSRAAVRAGLPLGHGARQRLDLPGRGPRPVRRARRLGPRRPCGRRRQPRGVHGDPLDQRPARSGRVPVLMPRDPDVLIVGAGPSGAVAAKRLAEDGFRVTVLEQGDWPDYSKARPEAADFDITATRDWAWDPNARKGRADYPIDDSESDITALMWNGVGGGTIVYAAQWQRNMPSDFRVRTLDGIADDWPLSYEDLEPYYERVEQDFGVSGVAGDTAFPPGAGPPLPAVPLGRAGRKVARAHNELGWHWWPAPNAIATRAYGNLNPCVQRGVCLKACKDHAKGTVDLTHWPVAQRIGVELITKATVRELTLGRDGLVTGAVYVDDDGAEHHVAAAGDDPRRERHRHAAAAAPLGRRAPSRRPGELVGDGGQAADDAPVRDRGRAVRGRAREQAGPVGPVAALARVLRDGHVARLRARGEVGAAADGRRRCR